MNPENYQIIIGNDWIITNIDVYADNTFRVALQHKYRKFEEIFINYIDKMNSNLEDSESFWIGWYGNNNYLFDHETSYWFSAFMLVASLFCEPD